MQYTLDQLHSYVYRKLDNVYEVFKNFFGEEFVDLQRNYSLKTVIASTLQEMDIQATQEGDAKVYELSKTQLEKVTDPFEHRKCYIYVWWPQVVVTNEHDKSITIQDLYAKVPVQLDGRIPYEEVGFLLNWATYTRMQFLCDYLHSHVHNIPKNDFSVFERPCLGTGPIGQTIQTLKSDYSEVTWMLFCQELAAYVTVESISGGPWRFLEHVGDRNLDSRFAHTYYGSVTSPDSYLPRWAIKEFTSYYLKHGHLRFNFKLYSFVWNMRYFDFIVDISNCFIEWFNGLSKAQQDEITHKPYCCWTTVHIADGKVYSIKDNEDDTTDLSHYQNKYVLTFKGKQITTTILEDSKRYREYTPSILLLPHVAFYILIHIHKVISFRYENRHNQPAGNQSTATTCKRVYYI